ncbi:hypothetical protein EDC04DRAFT_2609792 [Pisolithus marmoratus]|nr:hypothetical protein EDC04DRAFT_2609792 [Pisolithus marmoratus]
MRAKLVQGGSTQAEPNALFHPPALLARPLSTLSTPSHGSPLVDNLCHPWYLRLQYPKAQDSASQAGPSDHQYSIFHTLPHHCGNPDDPDNGPGNGSDGGGSSDRGIPEDPAELPEDPLLALMWAVHDLACSSQQSGDSTPKTKVHEPDTFDGSNPKKLWEFLVQCELNFQDHLHAFCSD